MLSSATIPPLCLSKSKASHNLATSRFNPHPYRPY